MMWQSAQWVRHGWIFGITLAVLTNLPRAGFAEQPLKQLPEDVVSFSLAWVALPEAMVGVTKDQGPLAGVSFGLGKGSSDLVGKVLNLMDTGPSFGRQARPAVFPYGEEARSPTWLNVHNSGARRARHEPVLLRYTF